MTPSRSTAGRRVFVIGLDCAAPELVFDLWREDLPNLTGLAARGLWGELESCTPAITVPAWSSMLTSKDPGTLGVYGFRNRADHGYESWFTATSGAVRERRVWDLLGDAGLTSVVVGVPQTYPVAPIRGDLVADFLTPGPHSPFAHPASLRDEVLEVAPDYAFDVPQFRTEEKDWLLAQIRAMTDARFRVIDHLLDSRPWDLFLFVEIGVDRIHHGFWSRHDPRHRRYRAGDRHERAIHDYYVDIDRQIGRWMERLDDDTAVLVVSDHGAKRMDGGIAVNEWLWRHGYLAFLDDPVPGAVRRFDESDVDWSRTAAWASGGYYGRMLVNVRGREPHGTVAPSDYESLRDELAQGLAAIPDADGAPIGTHAFKPESIYRHVNGVAPDLLVYFGDLYWRAIGSVGHRAVQVVENDTGPDDCNHAQNGLVILHDPRLAALRGRVRGAQLMDVAPTLLELFGVPVPADMQGRSLLV
jgi:predicted AlkP superfamily phosphohydrolase/phosphomutase